MKNDIFQEAEQKTSQLLTALNNVQGYFLTPKVPKSLLNAGLTYYKGVVVPLNLVSHRYIFEYYEIGFWDTFVALCEKVYEEREAVLSEFAFRTLLEMGIDESFILFDPFVEATDKKKYILLKILTDYGSIETSMQSFFNQWFNRLIIDHRTFINQHFSEKQKALIKSFEDALNNKQEDIFTKTLISTRRLCMRMKDQIISKHEKAGHIIISNSLKRMKSGEAHTIHGNIFLLPHRLNKQPKENHLFRVFMYLFYSGIEALTRVVPFLKNEELAKKTDPILNELRGFKTKLASEWGRFSKAQSITED